MRLEIKKAKSPVQPKNRMLLITGDGRSLPQDLERFLSWQIPHDVMAVGRSINAYPGRVLHWSNVDGADCKWWAEHLPPKNDGKLPIRHTIGEYGWFDVDWEILDGTHWDPSEVLWHGSTALFSVYAGLAMGYQDVILAGCPLDAEGHWFDPPEQKGPRWTVESFMAWLDFARTEEAKRVISLSGYTRQILGGLNYASENQETTKADGDCRTSS